jgi:hypothetical protein
MEAYAAVYAPQELTEEQVWEEVEAWVNSLVEEGYDLSDYTWEDMYETYLEEQGRGRVTGSNPNVWKPATTTSGPAGGGMGGRRGGGSSPGSIKPAAAKPAPATRPAATAPRPAAPTSAPATRPAAAAPSTKPPVAKSAPAKPATGMLGKTSFERRTPTSAELKAAQAARASGAGPEKALQAAKAAGAAKVAPSAPEVKQTATLAATPKPTPVAPNRATGSKKPGSAFEQFDAYDVVLEYLLDNGHADTVDEAHYVMMEMDGETIADIFEGRRTSLSALSRESQQRKADKERGRPETKAEIHGRLMLGKFRPSASPEERAEGGRERLKDRGKVPKKGGKDMFEQVLEHLLDEGYAETEEAAIEIIANMSEEWKQSIVEQSAIASRAAAVVDDQRRGSHGMAHDQKMTGDSIKKLNRYKGPRVTPGLPGA